MNKPLHSLNGLRAFEATARLGTLIKAADELHVTHGAVSRLITQLEQRLSVQLFERKNRALILTEQGQALYKSCSHAFEVLRHGLYEIQSSKNHALVVSCEPTIAMRWLIPRLSDFQQRYPHIPIHMLIGGGAVDFAQGNIDLAIRRNDFAIHPRDTQTFLADEWIAPVAHPQLLHSNQANELCQLHARTRPNAWETWQARYSKYVEAHSPTHQAMSFNSTQNLWFEHFYLTLQAAGAQLGVAIASIYMVGEELNNGTLSAPLPFIRDGSQYVVISPESKPSEEQRVFVAWLMQQFEDYQGKVKNCLQLDT